MILYFADKQYAVLGVASTNLPGDTGLHIISDRRSEEIGTGFDTYDYSIAYNYRERLLAEQILSCGNYIFRKSSMDDRFTAAVIIQSETDPVTSTITIGAEDTGLDLLNGLAPAYAPSAAKSIRDYVEFFIQDTGYEIGLNEFSDDYILPLVWDSDSTITERLLDIAKYFEAEIYCSFDIDDFWIKSRKVNIVHERGKDVGVQLQEGVHLSNIVVKRDMSNVATTLNPVGATPEGSIGIASVIDPQTDRQLYTWVKFADTKAGINMTDNGGQSLFIGINVNQQSMEESQYAYRYYWRRINYDDTVVTWKSNTSGFPMVTDGDSTDYTWVSFSKNSDGSDMSNNSEGMSYIGIATRKDTATKSTDPDEYEWFDLREESSERRIILIDNNNSSAVKDVEGYTWVKFGDSATGTGIRDNGSNAEYLGISVHRPGSTKSSSASDYEWVEITEASTNGGFTVAEPFTAGVRVGNNNYVWFRFTDMEEVGINPSDGSYIGFRYSQNVACPMSKDIADYDWHETSGDDAKGLTLQGYKYDDGDFYIDGKLLRSRQALQKWARDTSIANTTFGHIVRPFECNAETQQQLLEESIKELKKVRELEIEYNAEIINMPSNVRVGDTVRIADRSGELYLTARVIRLESSEVTGLRTATFGNYKVVSSGISDSVAKLAAEIRKRTEELNATKSRTIISVINYYASSTGDEPPETNSSIWNTEIVNQQPGQRVWQMTETTYGDGTKEYSVPTDITVISTVLSVQTFYAVTDIDGAPPAKPTAATELPPTGWSYEDPSSKDSIGDIYSTTLTEYSNNAWEYSDPVKVKSYKAISDAIDETDKKAEEAKNAAEEAQSTAKGVEQSFQNYEATVTELTAMMTSKGFTVKKEGSQDGEEETRLDSTGLRVVRDGIVIAQFDDDDSYVNYLKVNTFLSFGSHRAQTMTMTEFDGTSQPKGTGFFWTGGE